MTPRYSDHRHQSAQASLSCRAPSPARARGGAGADRQKPVHVVGRHLPVRIAPARAQLFARAAGGGTAVEVCRLSDLPFPLVFGWRWLLNRSLTCAHVEGRGHWTGPCRAWHSVRSSCIRARGVPWRRRGARIKLRRPRLLLLPTSPLRPRSELDSSGRLLDAGSHSHACCWPCCCAGTTPTMHNSL